MKSNESMKPIVVTSILVCGAVFLSNCKPVHNNSDVEQAVMDAQHRWEKALKQFDPESMQSLLAKDDLRTEPTPAPHFQGSIASWLHDPTPSLAPRLCVGRLYF